ncbi:HlyD family efflux transporter periplasmic adaptor subunit, partial [bacterium]|nr:HlyD family efflux transporter periplasmic adaptor subunit [bacterium]
AVLLRMADLSTLELRVYLNERDLDRVSIGGEVPVLVDAMAADTLRGIVTWVSSEAEFTPKNAQTRDARAQLVYAVKLRVSNPDGKLHIGMPAEIIL